MARTRTTSSFNKLLFVTAVGLTAAHARAQTVPAPQVQAEPSPADVETAKAQFTEGLALRDKGDHVAALARFRAAYALVRSPITGLEVGRELIDTGHVLEGRALLLDVSRMPKKAGESDRAQQARDEAADLAEKARAKLATLTVETSAADVTIDDVAIPKDAAHAPRVLDPGHHVVVVRSPSHIGRAEIELAPGDQHQIHVEADQADPEHPEHPQPPPKGRYVLHPGTPFYVSLVVTGAGLAIGAGTGIAALAITGHLANECPSKQCPPSAHGDLNASLALGWMSTVGFIVAGGGAIATFVTLALSGHREPPPTTHASLRIVPGPGTLSLTGTF